MSLPFVLTANQNDGQVPVVSTTVGQGRAINKLQWDHKDGRRAGLGGSDGKLYVYDIGDMALPRETEWTDLQRTVAGMVGGGGGQTNGDIDLARSVNGR
jgi:dynein intermediate chain, cytosolic